MIRALISDANILIDYAKANTKILKLAVRHLYEIYVPTVIADEVVQLSRSELKALGIKIVVPELDQIVFTMFPIHNLHPSVPSSILCTKNMTL